MCGMSMKASTMGKADLFILGTLIAVVIAAGASFAIPWGRDMDERYDAREAAIWRACAQTRGYNSYQECITFVRHGLRIGTIESNHEIEGVVKMWLAPEDFIEPPDDYDPYNNGCDKYAT